MAHETLKLLVEKHPYLLPTARKIWPDSEVEETIGEWSEERVCLAGIERDYRYHDLPKMQQELRKWKEEIRQECPEEVQKSREAYLKDEIAKLNALIEVNIRHNRNTDKLWKRREVFIKRLNAMSEAGRYTEEQIADATKGDWHEYLTFKGRFAHCPFHAERTPSFHVTPTNNIGHCFSCGWSGNLIQLIMAKEKMVFPQAVKFILGK